MSSYDAKNESYDRRTSRRHDSFTKPREFLSPVTSHDPRNDRRRNGSRRADARHYDGRPRSPQSGVSSDDQRSRLGRSPRRARTWPPGPTVESEARSLAREAGGIRAIREITKHEVPSRGTIDQDPVIEEVAEFANLHDRRFVMLSDSDSSSKSRRRYTPTSEDERRRQRRPSRINTSLAEKLPDLPRRTASPYAMSASSTPRPVQSSSDSYLSPVTTSAPSQPSRDRYKPPENISRPASRRKDGYADSAIDDTDAQRPASRDGPTQSAQARTISAVTSHLPRRDARRPTDVTATMPVSGSSEKSNRPSPLAASALAATALGAATSIARDQGLNSPRSASLNPPMFQREASLGSRNASPVSIYSQRSASPPSRSPRISREISLEQNSSPDSRQASASSSKLGSRNNSPPRYGSVAMPKMPQLPSDDASWNNLLVANAARRGAAPIQPSRLSTSMRTDSLPSVPRAVPRSAALPYPVNEGPATPDVLMPDYQWSPARLAQPEEHNVDHNRTAPESARPPRPARHSFTNSPTDARPQALLAQRPSTAVGPSRQEAEAMLAKGFPGCSRPEPVANYDDWYTMVGAPTLDFCPKCIESIFERTVYRKYFRRSVPRDLSTKISCVLGVPWARLAYLLTVQQRLPDLQLFKDLADIDLTSDPCPKEEEAVRTWYGLRDNQGLFVRDFQICYTDVRKLERLLPTFSGFFQRLPNRASPEAKRCCLRVETNRFAQYLNSIIDLHDQAHATRTLPDPMPFVALVERKLSLRECERDSLILDGLWHYIPSLPVFTVCEDCFEDVVEPELRKGSDIASLFNRAVQPAYRETLGTSCQLYSPRMRKVFARAIKDKDLRYLARKANERRDAELRLQEKHTHVIDRLERLDQGRGSSSDEEDAKRRLARELRYIRKEWKEEWE